jgi:histidinol-phosphate aminotransferase
MTAPLNRILAELPAVVPFVGPETLERRYGKPFTARLGANESAFGHSPKAQAAIEAELARIAWYCDPEHFDLRGKLAERLGVERDNVMIGEGIDGILGVIVRAFLDPGDSVVTSLGAYPTFNYHVNGYGGRIAFVPYGSDHRNDLEGLLTAARETGAKLLYLANPDNPTGTFLRRAAIEDLLAALPPDCLLLLDEAYVEFAPADEVPPIVAEDPRLLRLRTFSKAHGLAGLRLGYAIGARETLASFDKIRLHFGVGRLSQIAAAASLEDPGFVAEVVRQVAEGRRHYEAIGRAHNLGSIPSSTNFLAFDLASEARSERMVELLGARGIFVRRPAVTPLGRFVRVTVGTLPEREAFATAFAEALPALQEKE